MSLRGRTASILLLSITISALMAILVSRYFFLQSFISIEDAEVGLVLNQAQAMIEDDLDQLEMTVLDWAVWDDTYDFLFNATPSYIQSNLQESTFQQLGLSGFFIFGPDNILIFGYETDSGLGASIIEAFIPASNLTSSPDQAGGESEDGPSRKLVQASGYPHLAVGKSIQPNEGRIPGAGWLIMVRALDEKRAERYSRLLGMPVTVGLADGERSSMGPPRKTEDYLTAFLDLTCSLGRLVGYLALDIPRTISNHGTRSLSIYLTSVTASLGTIALVSLFILESLVFRQLRTIGTQLRHIASGVDPKARIENLGNDEIGLLADMMNKSLDTQQARLKERETMLQEIHHRVKNNLQIIASLLNLQSAGTNDQTSSHALEEGRRRVLALAFIQDELYSGADLTSIDLRHFLDGFIRNFEPDRSCYGMVFRKLESAELTIAIDQVVPIGLVLSEALANCYQHAFPGGRDGHICVRAREEGSTTIIEVEDDGIGLEQEYPRKSGLGLTLIEALAEQLHGQATLEGGSKGGSLLCLRFPSPDPSASKPARG